MQVLWDVMLCCWMVFCWDA